MRRLAETLRAEGKTVGCVPTMGYLHEGHASLIRIAAERSDVVVVTVFVNPTQFAPNEDFESYPRDFERDSKIADDNGAEIIFNPEADQMYPEGYSTYVRVKGVSEVLEGFSRPTHFEGVATVVAKLFNAVKPHVAVFGQKDYQQSLVIRRLTEDLNFGIEIVVAPIVREADGLAMSSRNKYLSPAQRKEAAIVNKALRAAEKLALAGETDRKALNAEMYKTVREVESARIDYVKAVRAETLEEPEKFARGEEIALLAAVYVGSTRLIDNLLVKIGG